MSEKRMNEDVDREKIIGALKQVLNDERFLVAPKSSALLEYVVLETLNGNADRIKAYSIAVDALHKPASFDPQENPSVRVMAKRVKAMLVDYYDRTTDHEIVFVFKAGSYVPRFVVPKQEKAKVSSSNC